MGDVAYVEMFDVPVPDLVRLGGKGAGLSRLVGGGHRVPAGFVITVDAFLAAIEDLGLTGRLSDLSDALAGHGDLLGIGTTIRAGLLESSVSAPVMEAVVRSVHELRLWHDNPDGLIVRSSATSEDTSELSFAGIFESVEIRDAGLLEPAIRRVWASGFSTTSGWSHP